MRQLCFYRILLLLSFLWGWTLPGISQDTISSLEQRAMQNHPAIAARRQRLEAMSGRWVQQGLGPNPTLEYFGEEISSENAGIQGVTVSQEMVTRGKLTHQQEVVAREIKAEEEALKRIQWKVQTDVRVAAYNYIIAEQRQTMLAAIVKINQSIHETARLMNNQGEATKLDVLNLEIELQKTQSELLASQNDTQATWYTLACVVGAPQMPRTRLADTLESEWNVRSQEEFDAMLLATSPEITQAQAKVATAQKRLELEYARNSSNITLTGGILYNDADECAQANVGISVPLRVRDRNQGNIAEARSEVLAAQQEKERVTLAVRYRLAETYRQYASAAANAATYRQNILPRAKQALELTRKSCEGGESTYLALLNAQRTYAEVYLAYLENLRIFWTQKTILEGKLLTGSLDDSLD